MKVYVVLFVVNYDGSSIDGIFSTREKALEQIELSKEAHNLSGKSRWTTYDNETWEDSYRDVCLVIKEWDVDRLRYS